MKFTPENHCTKARFIEGMRVVTFKHSAVIIHWSPECDLVKSFRWILPLRRTCP